MTAELIERTKAVKHVCEQLGASPDALDALLQTKEQVEAEIATRAKEADFILGETEKASNIIDLGEAQGVWYYGFQVSGKDAIITSDGKILKNTETFVDKKIVGINEIKQLFSYKSSIGDIAPFISKKAVKDFFVKTERLSEPKELYKTVRNKILHYMDFSGQDEIADVMASWIIATYCYPLFYWFPHVLINAPSGSGKSKAAKIMMLLSFRGFELNAAAGLKPAQITRTLEGNRGTLFIDEYEKMDGLNQESTQLCNQIFNASADRDAYIIVNEPVAKTWKPKKFPIFCPKITCNITGINPTSLSRFIAFKWLRTTSEKGNRKPTRQKDKATFEPIRDDLHILILENWQRIKEIYETLDINQKNRDYDNWLPLFAIAKFIDESPGENINVKGQLEKYLKGYSDVEVETDDNTAEFFSILKEMVSQSDYYTPKSIADFQGISDLLSHLKSPAHWIGRKLKLYGFKQSKAHGGIRQYLLSPEKISKVTETYFSAETTTPNDTNDTKCNQCNPMTPEKAGSGDIGGIGGITPECDVDRKKPNFGKTALIHLPCSVCGLSPCDYQDNSGKPLCSDCAESLGLQRPVVVEEVLQ